MAELAKKKKVRAGHRASTTRILGQINPAVETDPLDVPKITQLKRNLEDKLTSLMVLDDEILPLLDDEAIAEIVQADEQVYVALSRLEVAVKCTTAEHAPRRVDPPADRSPVARHLEPLRTKRMMKAKPLLIKPHPPHEEPG